MSIPTSILFKWSSFIIRGNTGAILDTPMTAINVTPNIIKRFASKETLISGLLSLFSPNCLPLTHLLLKCLLFKIFRLILLSSLIRFLRLYQSVKQNYPPVLRTSSLSGGCTSKPRGIIYHAIIFPFYVTLVNKNRQLKQSVNYGCIFNSML